MYMTQISGGYGGPSSVIKISRTYHSFFKLVVPELTHINYTFVNEVCLLLTPWLGLLSVLILKITEQYPT